MLTLHGKQVVLRSVEEADVPILHSIRSTPVVSEWWHPEPPEWPLSTDADTTRLTIWVDGVVAGLVQFYEQLNPDFRYAGIDLFLDLAFHRRGLGSDVLRIVIRHLTDERGHHRITIDPATDNTIAIRAYEKIGFRRVGVMESYWRDHNSGEWRDALLMELVVRSIDEQESSSAQTQN